MLKTITKILVLAFVFSMTVAAEETKQASRLALKIDQNGRLKKEVPTSNIDSRLLRKSDKHLIVRSIENQQVKAPRGINSLTPPYSEDFETASETKQTPQDFGFTVISADANVDLFVSSLQLTDGTIIPGAKGSNYYMALLPNMESTQPANEWIITDGITLQAGTEYRYEMYIMIPGYNDVADEFTVNVATGKTAAAMAAGTVVMDYTGNNAIVTSDFNFGRVRATFTPTTTGIYYFGIHYCSPNPSLGNAIAFDNISIAVPPASEAESAFIYYPKPKYTALPSFLYLPTTDAAHVAVYNVGTTDLTNVSTIVSLKKNNSEIFSNTVVTGTIEQDSAKLVSTSQPYTLDRPVAGQQDSYEISAITTSNEGISQTINETFDGAIFSNNLYARDNAEIGGTLGYPTAESKFGLYYEFPVQTKIDSVKFFLSYTSASATGYIYIYKFDSAEGRLSVVGGNQFTLNPATGIVAYAVKAVNTTDGDLIVDAGSYFVTIVQPSGVRLGLIYASENDDYTLTGIYDIGAGFDLLDLTPIIRLIVANPATGATNSTNINGVNVFYTGNNFELSYPSNVTKVSVYNANGQKVTEKELSGNSTTLPASDWTKGVYIFKLSGNGLSQTIKVMK